MGSRLTHMVPAGLPLGMPGIGVLMEGMMQHMPQLGLHSMLISTFRKQFNRCMRIDLVFGDLFVNLLHHKKEKGN